MALPVKKSTRNKTKSRASHFSLKKPGLSVCSNCQRKIPPHRACPFCGHYQGKEIYKVLTKEERKKAKEAKAKAKSEKRTSSKK